MTIALEHVQEGDWAAVNRALDALRALVPDTGGRSVIWRFGVAVATFPGGTDATGNVVVTHGLGHVPVDILLTCGLRSDGGVRTYASHFTETATTFTTVGLATGANPAAAVTVPINWLAIG